MCDVKNVIAAPSLCVATNERAWSAQTAGSDVPAPDVPALFRAWRDWSSSLMRQSPRRMVYVLTDPFLRDSGYSRQRVVVYTDDDQYFSRALIREPIPGRSQQFPPHLVAIFTPKYSVTLERNSESEEWQIRRAESPEGYDSYSDPYRRFSAFPGDIPPTSKSLEELYEWRVLAATEEDVHVEFVVRAPKNESTWRGECRVDRFEATFSRSTGWLPTRVDWHFLGIADNQDFWYCANFEDWQMFDAVPVPRLVREFEDRERRGEPFLNFHIQELERVPIGEVIDRVNLSYYGLPEMDLRTRPTRPWWVMVLLVVVVAGALYWGFRHRNAT